MEETQIYQVEFYLYPVKYTSDRRPPYFSLLVFLTFSTDKFPRLRIGIGSDEGSGAGHVLSNFNGSEQKNLNKILDYTCSIVRVYLHRGFQAAARLANDPEWNVKYWEELRRKNMK